ncbi:MAG TPA: FtsX-like permease family protein [Thermotogota bacterium]|nr:FtsX-like permease family protein [Thermotogota bacterium]HRW91946.1 FtsX-like permease family protein [Thermotogota bacterium]
MIIPLVIAAWFCFIGWSMLRYRLFTRISFRNIFRRKIDTFLIVFGALIGTAMISGSFAMNDSFKSFLYSQVEQNLGPVDEVLVKEISRDRTQGSPFSLSEIQPFLDRIQDARQVDGILPLAKKEITLGGLGETRKLLGNTSQTVMLLGMEGWESFFFADAPPASCPEERDGLHAVVLSQGMADALQLEVGDRVELLVNPADRLLIWKALPQAVVGCILPDDSMPGYSGVNQNRPYSAVWVSARGFGELTSFPADTYHELLVSNRGGLRDGVRYSGWVIDQFNESNLPSAFQLENVKQERLLSADSANFGLLFLGLSAFSILAGMLLIGNTFYMLAEERQQELGTLRALGYSRRNVGRLLLFEGFFYSLIASGFGVVAGLLIMRFILGQFTGFFDDITSLVQTSFAFGDTQMPGAQGFAFEFSVTPQSILYSFLIGIALPMVVVFFTSRRISRMNIVSAIRGIPEPIAGKWKKRLGVFWVFVFVLGLVFLVIGLWKGIPALLFTGVVQTSYGFCFGFPFKRRRIILTLVCLGVISFAMGCTLFSPYQGMENSVWLILLRTGAVLSSSMLLVIYNLKVLEHLVSLLFRLFKISPGVTKIAIAFPARNVNRTGLTIMMFTLVVFIIINISIIPFSQEEGIRRSEKTLFMGFDAQIPVIPFGLQPDRDALLSEIKEQPGVRSVVPSWSFGGSEFSPGQERQRESLLVFPQDFSLPEEIYRARAVAPTGQTSPSTQQKLLEQLRQPQSDDSIPVLWLGEEPPPGGPEVVDHTIQLGNGGPTLSLRIVGKLESDLLSFFSGYVLLENAQTAALQASNDPTLLIRYDAHDSQSKEEVGQDLTETVRSSGLFLLKSQDIVKLSSALIQGFVNILNSFLYFGMLVGITGIAIIMFRALHERKRIIGMLKAIGFTRRKIFQSFFLETSFVVVVGILLGMVAGVLTSIQFVNVLAMNGAPGSTVAIPWGNLVIMAVIFYGVSVVATLFPALLASRLPPAEALRYFE